MSEYNGWKNWATWNVALWISNDESLYAWAKEYRLKGYKAFALILRDTSILETPDQASYSDSSLDIEALDEMLREL